MMLSAISRDGTRIAFEKRGRGPALILVGGALADHTFYTPLAHELANEYTVYTFDRRGRGQSGDAPLYAVEREIADMAALISQANEAVYVYGHSAGSALALRAAAAGLDIARLALIDPPYTSHSGDVDAAVAAFTEEAARVQEMHDNGDHKGNAALFVGGFGLSPDDVEEMLQSPVGQSMIDCARALPYDYAVLGDGLVPVDLAATVAVPTIVMAAEATPQAAPELAAAMPNAQFQPMAAAAHELPPAEIAAALTRFFVVGRDR